MRRFVKSLWILKGLFSTNAGIWQVSVFWVPAFFSLHSLLLFPRSDLLSVWSSFCVVGSARHVPVYRSPRPVCMATRSSDRSRHQRVLGAPGGPWSCPHGGCIHLGTPSADINAGAPRSRWHYSGSPWISAVCHTEVIWFPSLFLCVCLKLWKVDFLWLIWSSISQGCLCRSFSKLPAVLFLCFLMCCSVASVCYHCFICSLL